MVFKNYYLLFPSLISAITFTVAGFILVNQNGDNILEPYQTILISLATASYSCLIATVIKILYDRHKYNSLAGKYIGYAYKNEDNIKSPDYYALKDTPQSIATLKYIGNMDFTIKIEASDHPSLDDLTWTGDFKLTSENMASIAWWYTNENMKYSIGYKKAVVKDGMIVLFSEDNSIHHREVFIKDKNATQNPSSKIVKN